MVADVAAGAGAGAGARGGAGASAGAGTAASKLAAEGAVCGSVEVMDAGAGTVASDDGVTVISS